MVSAFLPEKAGFPLERMFSSPGAAYALAAFAIVVGPFMEELIFRGVLFSIFEARAGLPITIMITAALFAAMHIPEYRGAWYHVLFIFLVGLVLSLARGLTQSLAPSVILHITYNTCLMVVLFFATSQFHAIQGAMK
jgi:membrane protease YdiL (CAAX protease family)